MALEISKTFTIDAPKAAVWEFLTDPYRVARCLPGAAITEKVDDRNYKGTITVKVGPVSASYKGKVRFEKLDAAAGTAEIVASGQDVKGKGGADMRMQSRLTEAGPARTEVAATSQVNITGILAQMGGRMIQDVSDQMLQQFTQAMQAQLASGPPGAAGSATRAPAAAAPLDAVALGAGVARRAAGRLLSRPAFWIALALAAVAAAYWLGKR
ncbi:MAG TPA: SRPBCC family protein [Thermoanaerobaculia bacterium]|nr:SRPBCC family protein [Thermoanaerobaculia bacterium]